MIKKIIFDLDGTLLFLSKEWEPSYKKFIDDYSLKISPKELFSCIGTYELNNSDTIVSKKKLCEYINDKLNININEKMLEILNRYYNNIPLLHVEKISGILSYLSNKYELIAYTNWYTKDQEYRLEKNKLKKYFKKIYGWDIIQSKPSKKAIEKITNNNINEYIVIGDTIQTDIIVPDSMGIKTIFYNKNNIKQSKYKEINNIEELKEIL